MRGPVLLLLLSSALSAHGLTCKQQSITLNSDGTLALSQSDFLTTWSSQGSVASSTCGVGVAKCALIAFVEDSGGSQTLRVSGQCLDPSSDLFYSKGISCPNSTQPQFAFDGTYAFSCCDTDDCNDQVLYTAVESELTSSFLPNCSTTEAKECVERYEEAYGCHQTSLRPPASQLCSKYLWGAGYSCLHQKCSCDCSGVQNLTESGFQELSVCQRKNCVAQQGYCAPGCNHSQVNDGVCDVLCMNEDCHFDGGDCLESRLSGYAIESDLYAFDTDYNMRVSKSEYDSLVAASGSYFPALTQAEYDILDAETSMSGLSFRQLAAAANSAGKAARAALVGSQSTERQLAHLELAVLLIGLADVDQDGVMTGEEAQALYAINRHEFTFLDSLDPENPITPDELAAMLRRVTETLGGRPWPTIDSHGLDVVTAAVIKMADFGQDGQMSIAEADSLSLPTVGFGSIDLDSNGHVSPKELQTVVEEHSANPCMALHAINHTSGEIHSRVPVPGFGPPSCQFLIMPHWHHYKEFEGRTRAVCPHTHEEDNLRSTKQKQKIKKSKKAVLPQQDFDLLRWQPGAKDTEHRLGSFKQGSVMKEAKRVVRSRASPEQQHQQRKLLSLQGSPSNVEQLSSKAKGPHLRVVDGDSASYMQFPFMVSLEQASCGVGGFLSDAIHKGFEDFIDEQPHVESNETMLKCSHASYMYLDLVMLSADFNGDGYLVVDETCLPQSVFNVYAANISGFEEAVISRATVESMIVDWLVTSLDGSGDGLLSSSEAPLSTGAFDYLVSGSTVNSDGLRTVLRALRQMYPLDIRDYSPMVSVTQNDKDHSGLLEYMEAPELFSVMGRLANETITADEIGIFVNQANLTDEVQSMAGCAYPPEPQDPSVNVSMSSRRLLSLNQGGKRTLLQMSDDSVWSHYCGGTLIHPRWVLTAASCISDYQLVRNTHRAVLGGHVLNGSTVDGFSRDEGCDAEEVYFSRVVVHPAYTAGDLSFDVALIQLDEEVSFPPVMLHDGGDIDHLECKKLNLTAVGWGLGPVDNTTLQHVVLDSIERQDCSDMYYMKHGYRAVSAQEHTLCAGLPDAGPCHGDTGGPLLVPYKKHSTGWLQVGVTNGGVECGASSLPGVYTRVSAVYPWILAVSELGAAPPKRIRVVVDRLQLPSNMELEAFAGAGREDITKIEELESKCEAGTVIDDNGSGVLLLSVKEAETETTTHPCTGDCLRGSSFSASFHTLGCEQHYIEQQVEDIGACEKGMDVVSNYSLGIEGCMFDSATQKCGDPQCILEHFIQVGPNMQNVIYEDVVNMEAMGKSFSGSLGSQQSSNSGVWVCVRDWNPDQQRACAIQRGELACFLYDEASKSFQYYGRNSDVNLVSGDRYEDGVHRNFLSISHLP